MSQDDLLDSIAPGDFAERKQNRLLTVNRSAMQRYRISLEKLSANASNFLLKELWCEHANIMDDTPPRGIDNLADPINLLIPNKHMVRNSKNWTSNFGSISDQPDIQNSLSAIECTSNPRRRKRIEGINIFKKNLHKTDPSLFVSEEQTHFAKPLARNNSSDSAELCTSVIKINQKNSVSHSLKSLEATRSLIHSKNTASFSQNECSNSTPIVNKNENYKYEPSTSTSVFKTARDQLISSDPAAKRSLGTARKPQSKFVSPMMTEKKEDKEFSEIGDPCLKHIDPKMVELIQSEIIDNGAPIAWEDIAGLKTAKAVIQEAVVWPLLRPDIFTGLRRPPKGVLLFGPPGTGKTLIGKCVASQCQATFFNISASSLTSKWIGDGEKMVRALFAVAKCHQPAVIFIDEIDSLLTQRSDAEHEATRRIKTEFLVQFDGAGTGEEDRILIIGATNRPQELDEAARRRLVKRLYIPLPDCEARKQIVSNLMRNERNNLEPADIEEVCKLSEGFSGADMRSLCSEAAMGPIRSVPLSQIVNIQTSQVRAVCIEDFRNALQRVRPSVSPDDLAHYIKWDATYGHGC